MRPVRRMLSSLVVALLVIAAGTLAELRPMPPVGLAFGGAMNRLNDVAIRPARMLGLRSQATGAGSNTSYTYAPLATTDGVANDDERITVQIPTAWNQVEMNNWSFLGQQVGTFVAASPNLNGFYSLAQQPGVFIGASHLLAQQYTVSSFLNTEQTVYVACKYKGRFSYADNFYSGSYDQYTNCGNGLPNLYVCVMIPPNQSTLVLVIINAVSNADQAAKTQILQTFQVLPQPD